MTESMVSVVLSVYKPDKGLFRKSIESILKQDYSQKEIIIVDDGNNSSDRSLIEEYLDVPGVTVLRNNKNIGLTKSLNKAIGVAKGKYIARHDADDISDPTRLTKQVCFLNQHGEVSFLGTNYSVINDAGGVKEYRRGTLSLKTQMMYKNPFCHPSMMFRRELFLQIGGYNESYRRSQDFELWLRMLKVSEGEILDENLVLRHELKGVSLSTSRAAYSQFANGVKLRVKFMIQERDIKLLPLILIGAIYHLIRIIKNAFSS